MGYAWGVHRGGVGQKGLQALLHCLAAKGRALRKAKMDYDPLHQTHCCVSKGWHVLGQLQGKSIMAATVMLVTRLQQWQQSVCI